ncbi:MAG: hypothetical protein OEW72_06480 [Gammaproteobacteria bacterium]|nr:hypothetical protein [Gammaproteobacteria bacterium]
MPHRMNLLRAATLLLAGTAAQAAGNDCADPRARHFDFWIGDWQVVNANGTVAGRNRIEAILDGCVLQETWAGTSGSAGTSLNFFDTGRGKWRQFWVWREGTTLELEGGLVNGAMVMEGDSLEDGAQVLNRITWTRRSGGKVNQLWEVSADNGKTWKSIFDGMYHPAE